MKHTSSKSKTKKQTQSKSKKQRQTMRTKSNRYTDLLLAEFNHASNADLEKVQTYIKKGAHVNKTNKNGHTPLFLMIYYNDASNPLFYDTLILLLEYGAHPNTSAVLNRATLYENYDIIEILLHYGADPNLQSQTGQTPLHLICNKTYEVPINTDIVALLLEAGANPNLRDEVGETPLFGACREHHVECVDLLLRAGADPAIMNQYQQSAADVLDKDGSDESEHIAKMLKNINKVRLHKALLDAPRTKLSNTTKPIPASTFLGDVGHSIKRFL